MKFVLQVSSIFHWTTIILVISFLVTFVLSRNPNVRVMYGDRTRNLPRDCTQEPSEHACDYPTGNLFFNARTLRCEEPQFDSLARVCAHPPNKYESMEECEGKCGRDRI